MRAIPWRQLRTVATAGLGIAVIVLVLAWLMGAFHDKVAGGPPRPVLPAAPAAPTLTVVATDAPIVESAVGTVEAIERVRVGSRLLARVVEVGVVASQRVEKGDVLVRLDDRDLKAAVAEAKAALDSALAAQKQAGADLDRSKELLARNVASTERVERDATGLRRANAEVERAREALSQADTRLGFATIRAPSSGIVIEKHVEAGNLAVGSPGTELEFAL